MIDTPKDSSSEVAQLREQLEELRASDPRPQLAAAKQQVADAVTTAAADVKEAVAKPVHQGVERVRGAVASARTTAAQVEVQVEAQRQSLSQQVRNKPMTVLGVAALSGYLLGRIVR